MEIEALRNMRVGAIKAELDALGELCPRLIKPLSGLILKSCAIVNDLKFATLHVLVIEATNPLRSQHVQRCEAVIRRGLEIAGYGSHGNQLSHMRVFGLPKDEVADRECWLQM